MTVLELMVVLAIIAGASLLVRSGFRLITKADLVENSTELSAIMRRASTLAVEHGEMHRVVIDLDTQVYTVEVCQGAVAIQRNEVLRASEEDKAKAREKGKNAFANMPVQATEASDPQDAEKRAMAVAGHHIADRTCVTAADTVTGDAKGREDDERDKDRNITKRGEMRGWTRKLRAEKRDQVQRDLGPAPRRERDQGSGRDLLLSERQLGEIGGRAHRRHRDLQRVGLRAHRSGRAQGRRLEGRQRPHAAQRARRQERETRGRQVRKHHRGFTLIEVMFALALLGLALVVLIKSAAGSVFNAEQAHMMGVVHRPSVVAR